MFRIVIPARYASSRLPGKPLLELAGKPLLQWVHERALGYHSGGAPALSERQEDRVERHDEEQRRVDGHSDAQGDP